MPIFNEALKVLQRIRWPNLAAATCDILEAGARTFMTAPPDEIRAFRNITPTEDVMNWLKEDLPKTAKTLKGTFHEFVSPDIPLGRSTPGKAIYDRMQKADLDVVYAHAKIREPFEKLAKGISEEGSTKAYRAVENPALMSTLNKKEKALAEYAHKDFDFLWKSYIFHKVGRNTNDFNKVFRMADRGLDAKELEVLPEHLQEGYNLARATIKDYVPRIWKRENLIPMLENSRMQNALKAESSVSPAAKKHYEKIIAEYDESLKRLNGGDPLSYDNIPKEILFRHGLLRKGALGYEEDLIRSHRSYTYHLVQKMVEEPALKDAAELFKQLPFEQRPYARWFLRDFAGFKRKSALDNVAGKIASFEYVRTLGFNTRSPLVNLTQPLNTWADAGPIWSVKGSIKDFSKEGRELWNKTGLSKQIPTVLTEDLHPEAGTIERLKRIAGAMFNLAENANRRHAFATYYAKYENKFCTGSKEAFDSAIKSTFNTQFAYGRVGMPKILRTAPGRVIGQFGSYSIKQLEYLGKQLKAMPKDIKEITRAITSPEFDKRRGEELWRIAKENPLKFIQWIGLTEGGNYGASEILGVGMSNSLGFGMSYGEALEAFRSMTKGEFDEMWAHGSLAFSH